MLSGLDNKLEEYFDYCEIPVDGQSNILTQSFKFKLNLLEEFYRNKFLVKYGDLRTITARFAYNERLYSNLYHYTTFNSLKSIVSTKGFLIGNQKEMLLLHRLKLFMMKIFKINI